MKNKKIIKSIVFLAVIAVLTASIAVFISNIGFNKISAYFSVFTFSDEFNEDKQPLSTYNYDKLSSVEKQAYICVFNKIRSHPDYIKIPKLSKAEFSNVYFAVKNDNPDLLCFADSCNMITFWSSAFLELHYDYTCEECDSMRDAMLDEVNAIVTKMPEMNDDYSKELYIHDYIVNNCNYEETEHSSTAYGCLVDKKAVCSGYSRAIMLLLNELGIKSTLIGGTGISATQGSISHMWNIVWINESPYHVDVTWDDPGSDSDSAVSHIYFNLTDDEISFDHTDYDLGVDCNSDDYNYFVVNELYFDSYGKKELARIQQALIENINGGINYLEIKFDSNEDYKTAASAIIDGSAPGSDMYKIILYVSENAGDKVDISHVNFARDDNKNYIRLMFDWK